MDIKAEIEHSSKMCTELELLVANRAPLGLDERGMLLVAYWNLVIDYHLSVTSLLRQGYYGRAFALVRPIVEAWLRAHLVVSASDSVVQQIREDKYRTNFQDVASQIDQAFGLQFFGKTLNGRVRKALHSHTHSGGLQVCRRFDGANIKPSYNEAEQIEVVRLATLTLAMVTVLLTKKQGFDAEWSRANQAVADCL